MSSDEDEEIAVPGRSKRAVLNDNKTGRSRLRTLAEDSSDDDGDGDENLFEDSDDEENPPKADPGAGGGDQAEHSYSSESLKKALTRLKGSLDPSLPYDEAQMTSWAGVEDAISDKKQIKLQDLAKLVDDISTSTLTLSLEFKCVVSLVSAQTCQIYKTANEPKNCQKFFKSKDKDNKSKHVANFVSNLWVKESYDVLQKSSAATTEINNMHIKVLQYGLRFMESAFVIDNAKKLNVLKDKQDIDWKGLADQIAELSNTQNWKDLCQSAQATQKHFASFLAPQSTADKPAAAAAVAKTEDADAAGAIKIQRKLSLQEINARKREERMANMKRKAQGTSIRRTSSTATPSATSGGGLTSMLAAQAGVGGGESSSARAHPAASVATTNGTWGTTEPKPEPPRGWNPKRGDVQEHERPPPSRVVTKPASSDYTGSSSRNSKNNRPTQDIATIYGAYSSGSRSSEGAHPPHNTTATFPAALPSAASANYNQESAWSGGGSGGDRASWNASSSSARTSSHDVGGARGSGAWRNNSSSNDVTTSHDNQSGSGGSGGLVVPVAPGHSGYGGGAGGVDNSGPMGAAPQHGADYPPYAQQLPPPNKKRPQNDNDDHMKRPRNDEGGFGPRDAQFPPPAPGAGRGRGQTLPAWLTAGQGNPDGGGPYPGVGGPTGDMTGGGAGRGLGQDFTKPASMTSSSARDQHAVMPPGRSYPPGPADSGPRGFADSAGGPGRGRGRGRDVNLPAWITNGGGGGGGPVPAAIPPAEAAPPPPTVPINQGGPPPPIRGGFPDGGGPGGGGRGRGRGRDINLPAWMTQNNNNV